MVGIIAAMDVEIQALKKRMTCVEEKNIKNIEFTVGKLSGVDIVLCKSGIGKVYAAISTTILIDEFKPDYLINIGSAGSLKSNIRVGSVVIPHVIAHHDCDVPGWPKGFNQDKRAYKADEALLQIAETLKDERTYFDPMVSGDSFIYLKSQTTKILEEYPEAGCSEMEGASVAQTASFFNVPFIVIRSISDVTIEEGNEISFEEFVVVAAENSAEYCQRFVMEKNK